MHLTLVAEFAVWTGARSADRLQTRFHFVESTSSSVTDCSKNIFPIIVTRPWRVRGQLFVTDLL
jgi:hypothetical protein